jgi:hypothetical protein
MNGRRKTEMTRQRPSLIYRWQQIFSPRQRRHDPMLVLNMTIFNLAGGWNRIFNQLKIHENVT